MQSSLSRRAASGQEHGSTGGPAGTFSLSWPRDMVAQSLALNPRISRSQFTGRVAVVGETGPQVTDAFVDAAALFRISPHDACPAFGFGPEFTAP